MTEGKTRSQFTIPAGIYNWLKQQAAKESRSINKQLAVELEARRRAKDEQREAA